MPVKPKIMRFKLPGARSLVVDLVLILVLLAAVNIIFLRGDPGLLDVNPHPLWFVVVFIAMFHGFAGGITAGILCGGLLFGLEIWSVPDVSLIEVRQASMWARPLGMAVLGVILGELRQVQMRTLAGSESERQRLGRELGRLEAQYKALREVKEEIDNRIIGQEQTLSTLYQAAQALRSLDEGDIAPAVLGLARDYMGMEAGAILMRDNGNLKAKASLEGCAERLLAHDPLPAAVLETLKTGVAFTLNRAMTQGGNGGDVLICAPIALKENAPPDGVLVVERLPFIKFNQEAVRIAELLADWCGTSTANARTHQEARAKMITDDYIEAYTPMYLPRRLREEFARARRYSVPLSLLYIRLPRADTPQARHELLTKFGLAAKETVRVVDLLFLCEREGDFVLVLPNTPLEGAHVVNRNLTALFTSLLPEKDRDTHVLSIGTSCMSMNPPDHETMLQTALDGVNAMDPLHETLPA